MRIVLRGGAGGGDISIRTTSDYVNVELLVSRRSRHVCRSAVVDATVLGPRSSQHQLSILIDVGAQLALQCGQVRNTAGRGIVGSSTTHSYIIIHIHNSNAWILRHIPII